jgi:hypothetical protein
METDPRTNDCSPQVKLHLVLYLVEKEFDFNLDGQHTGLRGSTFSQEFREAISQSCVVDSGSPSTESVVGDSPTTSPHESSYALSGANRDPFLRSLRLLSTSTRSFSTSSQSLKRPPGLTMRVPNFMRWFKAKLDVSSLKMEIDPKFDQSEFLVGCKQALPTVTQHIRDNSFDELTGLFSKRAKEALRKEVETSWSDQQRNNIDFEDEDIISVDVLRVTSHRVAYDLYVDIDVHYDLVKMVEGQDDAPPIFAELELTFSRKYSQESLPDWIITKFNVEAFGNLCN